MTLLKLTTTYRNSEGAVVNNPYPSIGDDNVQELRITPSTLVLIKADGSKVTFVYKDPVKIEAEFIIGDTDNFTLKQ